jgi:preprotein translocase subunit YajC
VTTYTLIAEEAAPTAPDQTQSQPGGYGLLVMMGLIFAVFYFLLIRPQRKKEQDRQKQREEMLKNLKKNDHIVTIGGMHGIVASVTETDVVLKADEKSDIRLRFTRDAISRVVTEDEGKDAGDAKKLDDSSDNDSSKFKVQGSR